MRQAKIIWYIAALICVVIGGGIAYAVISNLFGATNIRLEIVKLDGRIYNLEREIAEIKAQNSEKPDEEDSVSLEGLYNLIDDFEEMDVQLARMSRDLHELSDPLTTNPCDMGAETGIIHTYFDENWVCNRCGEYVGPQYDFTDDDIYILAQLLCGDASIDGDGEYDFVWGALYSDMNYEEMCKVLCVVMNRVKDVHFPNTVREVVLQSGAFVVFPRNLNTTPHETAIEKVRDWCDAYDRWDKGVQVIPENHLYFNAGPNLTNITRAGY